jgi:site-specific recombinase XerD
MNEWSLQPDRYLSKEELGKLLRKAEELRSLGVAKGRKQSIRDWLIIQLAIYSGLRVSELAALKVTDCFIGYGRSELLVRRGKGGKQRVVKIGDHLKKCLRWYIRWKAQQGELSPDAYLLRSQRSVKMNRGAVWYRWKAHCPEHRAHDARHSFGTMLLEASGGNLRVVQKALGHSRITTTTVYADVVDEKTRESMKAMDQLARQTMKPSRNQHPGRMALAALEEDRDEAEFPAIP